MKKQREGKNSPKANSNPSKPKKRPEEPTAFGSLQENFPEKELRTGKCPGNKVLPHTDVQQQLTP